MEAYVAEDPRRTFDISISAQFATHQEIWSKHGSMHKTSNYEKFGFFCDAPLNFASFDPKIKLYIGNRMCKQTENTPFLF